MLYNTKFYNTKDYPIQTSLLGVPQAFIECEVRVYDKRRVKDRDSGDQVAIRYSIIANT